MTTTISNPQLLPSLPRRHPFKPHFLYNSFLKDFSKEKLCKRNYKYIHSFRISKDKRCPKIISRLKSISSLNFIDNREKITNFPLLKKLFKFHQKCLRSLGKGLRHIGKGLRRVYFQRLLPFLDQLTVDKDSARWKLLTSRSAFKTLIFDLQDSSKQTIQNFLKYKSGLLRNLPKVKALNNLKIKAFNEDTDLILSMLEMINEKVHLESLKDFDLSIQPNDDSEDDSEDDAPEILEQKPEKIERALESLTKLSIGGAERYSFLFSLAKFDNLSDLHLGFCPEEGSEDFRQIALFKDLPKLEKFRLCFEAQSFACEAQFFEHFIVPSTVEHLNLTLSGFKWNETPLTNENYKEFLQAFENSSQYINFFERIQNCCQNVKTLKLSTQSAEGTPPAIIRRFARLFVQRFTRLEQINFEINQEKDPDLEDENPIKQPFDLGDFFKGLRFIANTLTSIEIESESNSFTFSENTDALETKFLRLENLTPCRQNLFFSFCFRNKGKNPLFSLKISLEKDASENKCKQRKIKFKPHL